MVISPYKTKTVEKIHLLPKKERARRIKRAGYNLFFLNSEDIYIDFLTDSGTGAMSEDQWAGIMRGDESYAGSTSFRNLKRAVQNITGFTYVLPVHQGRGAENVFNGALVKSGMVVPGNAPFDTTRAHIEYAGGTPLDCTIRDAYQWKSSHPFKGNVDLRLLEKALSAYRGRTAHILVTVTCNQVGGQPVSLENITAVSRLARRFRVKLFFDGARFAENAYFIKEREKGMEKKKIPWIVREMMRYADGMLMSSKKDAIVNMGGFIALRDKEIFSLLAPRGILMEGFLHYGGMSGRDMEALAVGLREGIEEDYLRHRVAQVRYLGEGLLKTGVPVLTPVGGHAVYIDATRMLPRIPWYEFPGHALAVAAYLEGGIRGVEIGSIMEGRDPATEKNKRARQELLRLAIPRRVYSQEHVDYVLEVFKRIWQNRKKIHGVGFMKEAPILRHFSSRFKIL